MLNGASAPNANSQGTPNGAIITVPAKDLPGYNNRPSLIDPKVTVVS